MRRCVLAFVALLPIISFADVVRSSLAAKHIVQSVGSINSCQVEYLESTPRGNQFIDLRFVSNIDRFCDFEIQYRLTENTLMPGTYGWELPFGYRYGASARYGMWSGISGKDQEMHFGVDSAHMASIPRDEHWHIVKVQNGVSISIDGVVHQINSGSVRNNIKAYLFATTSNADGSGIQGYSSAQISYFKLWNTSGHLLCNLVPWRFVNENGLVEGAMYDLVSGQFFRNSGSVPFVIGPDKK